MRVRMRLLEDEGRVDGDGSGACTSLSISVSVAGAVRMVVVMMRGRSDQQRRVRMMMMVVRPCSSRRPRKMMGDSPTRASHPIMMRTMILQAALPFLPQDLLDLLEESLPSRDLTRKRRKHVPCDRERREELLTESDEVAERDRGEGRVVVDVRVGVVRWSRAREEGMCLRGVRVLMYVSVGVVVEGGGGGGKGWGELTRDRG